MRLNWFFFEHFYQFGTSMKLRTNPSRSLQWALQSTAPRNGDVVRRIRIKYSRELHRQNGRRETPEMALRSSFTTLIPTDQRPQRILPAPFIAGQRRTFATVKNGASCPPSQNELSADQSFAVNSDDRGPMMEYDRRVADGRLRDDEHQRG